MVSLYDKFNGNAFKAAGHLERTVDRRKLKAYKFSFARFAKRYNKQALKVSFKSTRDKLQRKANFYELVSDYLKKAGC